MGLIDVAFPYRAGRSFGVASFALVFLVLIIEIELMVFIAIALVLHRFDLFVATQVAIFPAAAAVSLVAAGAFAWRARAWTRSRIAGLRAWSGGSDDYAAALRARVGADGPWSERS